MSLFASRVVDSDGKGVEHHPWNTKAGGALLHLPSHFRPHFVFTVLCKVAAHESITNRHTVFVVTPMALLWSPMAAGDRKHIDSQRT